jgi:K+-sensing histidine kinase KdpD
MPHRQAPELSELVVMMAHDLKNSLAALMTNLHFLQGSISEPDQDALDALGDSVTLCEVLERFLCNLDLLARRRDITACPQPVGLGAIAHAAVHRVQSQAKAAGVELWLSRDGASDPCVLVDRDLFARAAENLIANALENAPAGSKVEVGITSAATEAAIVITDAREVPLPWIAGEASPWSGGLMDGKRLQGLYGRGLALLCADLAAGAAGARLEIDGVPGACRLRLVALLPE